MVKKSKGLIAALIVFALALGFGVWSVGQVGDHLQYLVEAPHVTEVASEEGEDTAAKPNQTLLDWKNSFTDAAEELSGIVDVWTLGGVKETASYTADNGGSGQGRLCAVGENGLQLNPKLVLYGRLFYPEEIETGDNVMLLDEQMALTLFNIGDPVERTVTLEGVKYRVVGIVRHTKQVGDYAESGAYIPLMSVIPTGIQLDAVQVEAKPLAGKGASIAFSTVVKGWQSGGTFIDLGKESVGATLWMRVLAFLIGAVALLKGIGVLNRMASTCIKKYRLALQNQYAVRLMPKLVGGILLFAMGYGAALALAAVLMNYIIEPVYTFPEWVPAILVEWEDIRAAFWKVWQTSATLIEWRTPELLRLRYFTLLIQGCSAMCGVLLGVMAAKARGRRTNTVESLESQYREGVVVMTLRTTNSLLFSEMGYIPCHTDEDGWDTPTAKGRGKHRKPTQAMLRIINARRILEQLPPSAMEGQFVLDLTDNTIESNNHRYHIVCDGKTNRIDDAERDYDLQMSVEALAQLVYGTQSFHDFMENHAGYDLKMRSPAMDGLFAHHLSLTKFAK